MGSRENALTLKDAKLFWAQLVPQYLAAVQERVNLTQQTWSVQTLRMPKDWILTSSWEMTAKALDYPI